MPPMTFRAKVCLLICILSASFLYGTGHPFLFGLSILNTVNYFWSLDVMDNFAREKYRNLWIHEWKSLPSWAAEVAHKQAVDAVPNWISSTSMLSTFLGIGLLIYGITLHVKTE